MGHQFQQKRRGILLTILSLVLFNYLTTVSCYNERSKTESHRKSRFLMSLSIPPTQCGPNNVGVCLPSKKCVRRSGTVVGTTCANGLGECCSFSLTCTPEEKDQSQSTNGSKDKGTTQTQTGSRVEVTEYVTTLTNPTPATTPCSYTIRKKKDVCQIRLDFNMFSFPSANSDGICDQDRLIVGPSGTLADSITTCGDLGPSGTSPPQHMYKAFGNQDSIEITPRIISASSKYEILVTQIPCKSSRLVPSFCLQYHSDPTGIVRSFDYRAQGQQQSNQKYVICVARPESSSAITWTPCSGADAAGVLKPFFITGPNPLAPNPRPIIGDNCTTDWISFNGDKRYCGDAFPTQVTSSWRPYSINVNFDQIEIPPFPLLGANPGLVTRLEDCVDLGTNSGGLWVCTWSDLPVPNGSCECGLSPEAVTAGINPFLSSPLPDHENTGFCLKYQV